MDADGVFSVVSVYLHRGGDKRGLMLLLRRVQGKNKTLMLCLYITFCSGQRAVLQGESSLKHPSTSPVL